MVIEFNLEDNVKTSDSWETRDRLVVNDALIMTMNDTSYVWGPCCSEIRWTEYELPLRQSP